MEILRIQTKVLPGHRIEVSSPDLPEGQEVEVEIRLSDSRTSPVDYSDPRELLKLTIGERRPYLEAAAEQAVDYYSQPDPERDAWQGGDIVEY